MERASRAASALQRAEPQVATAPQGKKKNSNMSFF